MFFQHRNQCDETNEIIFLTCKSPNFEEVVLHFWARLQYGQWAILHNNMNSMCHYKPHQLYGLLQAIQYERYGLLQAITIINRYTPNGLAYKVRTQCGKHNRTPEIITIRFAGWISGRIVSLQPDTDIQKLLSNGNRLRISDSLISMFRGFRLLEKVAHCTIIHSLSSEASSQPSVPWLRACLWCNLCTVMQSHSPLKSAHWTRQICQNESVPDVARYSWALSVAHIFRTLLAVYLYLD